MLRRFALCPLLFSMVVACVIALGRSESAVEQLAFQSNMAGNEDIFLLDVRTALVVNLTARRPGNETSPSWSPDGAQIAFEYASPGTHAVSGIEVMTYLGQPMGRVYAGTAAQPHWSPDGRSLSMTVGQTVYVTRVTPAPVEAVLTNSVPDYSAYGLWLRLKQRQSQLLPGQSGGVIDASWSSDRAWIGFTVWDGSSNHFYRMQSACLTSCAQLALRLPNPVQGRAIALSFRGEFAAYECRLHERSGICTMQVDGTEMRQVFISPRGVRTRTPIWRP